MTPIPTTGELGDLSSGEDLPDPDHRSLSGRRPASQQDGSETSLKSLLKKNNFDNEETAYRSIADVEEENMGNMTPKKVHFSEIDQVKRLSQDSDPADTTVLPILLCKTVMSSTPSPSVPTIVPTMSLSDT